MRLIKSIIRRINKAIEYIKLKYTIQKYCTSEYPVTNMKSNDIIVLGNGPSLSYTVEKYKDILKKKHKICVNHFSISEYYQLLKPEYYIVLDPLFKETDKSKNHFYDKIKITIKSIIEKTDWNMIIFLPYSFKDSNLFTLSNIFPSNIKIEYFNDKTFEFSYLKDLEYSYYKKGLLFPFGCGQNVLHSAINISLLIGYKKILLVGVDHNWHEKFFLDRNTMKLFLLSEHHYTKGSEKVTFQYFNVSEAFAALSKMFKGYDILKRYSEYLGVKIINLCEESWIDSFEIKSFEDI